MREKALDYVATRLSDSFDQNCDALLDEKQLIDLFGERYAENPEKFMFLPGQISTIKALVSHVKTLVDGNGQNTGMSQFNEKRKKGKKNNTKSMQLHKIVDEKNRRRSTTNKSSTSQLTNKLFEKLLVCLKSFGVDIAEWSEKSIEVDASGTYGNIYCKLCDESENAQPKRVFYYSGKSSFWVLSNFEKHLKVVHSLKVDRIKSKRTKHVNTGSKVPANHKIKVDDDVVDDSLIEKKCIPESSENDSVIFLGVASTNASQPHSNANSEYWLYTQMSQQIEEMIAATLINGETEEIMQFRIKNDDQNHTLSVVETNPDGNCLFSALAHQLWPNSITSTEHLSNTKKLRSIVVEHILKPDNFHLYEDILHDCVDKKKTENAESLTTECKLYVRHGLSRSGKWGGLETIKAVSNEYRVNIVIINEYAASYMVTGSQEYAKTLIIAYRLNDNVYNHYDSVCDMKSDDAYSIANFIINKEI